MNPDRFERLRKLVLDTADLPGEERKSFLEEACKDDPELLREAQQMLAHDTGQDETPKQTGVEPGYPEHCAITETISHYRILEKAGVGGMGVVYKAEDLKLKRFVALKFLPGELAQDPIANARFVREAQAAAALDHPNICTIHEIQESDSESFIAMAYVDGETLTAKIREGPLSLDEALAIGMQVAEGLSAAHAKGVIHRDIKPGNILLTRDGDVKITDFGLAKIISEPLIPAPELHERRVSTISGARARVTDQSMITFAGTRMGTGGYMSPEQARGETVDHRTDIWSFGVVLYEMLAGERPFTGENEEKVLESVLNEDPVPLCDLRADVPPQLGLIVKRALAKKTQDRYKQIVDILKDLKIVVEAMETGVSGVRPAPSGNLMRRIKSTTRRTKLTVITAGVVIVAGIVGTLLTMSKHADINLDPNRVVVAVFENRTGDESLSYLGPLVADRIAEQLSQIGSAGMTHALQPFVSSAAVHYGPGSDPDLEGLNAIARESDAAIVVSGAYYLVGDSVQFQARITDVPRGRLICAPPSTSSTRDAPSDAIEVLRQRTAGALAAFFDPHVGLDPGLPPPRFDAYREYLAGAGLWAEGKDFAEGVRRFSRAIELDSTFTTPYFWLYGCHYNTGGYAAAEALMRILNRYRDRMILVRRCLLDSFLSDLRGQPAEAWRHLLQAEKAAPDAQMIKLFLAQAAVRYNRPREAVERFTAMAPPESVYALGQFGTGYFYDLAWAYHLLGDYQKELEIARSAREYYPDLVAHRIAEARALTGLERIDEVGLVALECAAMSHPGYALVSIANELRVHGHPETADSLANEAVAWYMDRQSDPGAPEGIRYGLGRALYAAGRWVEALALFKELTKGDPDDIDYKGNLGVLAARTGDHERAWLVSSELEAVDRPYLFGLHTYRRACIASQLGELELAVRLLGRAFAAGFVYIEDVHSDRALEPLWSYPPFQELIRPKS